MNDTNKDDLRILAENLRIYRIQKGISQETLAMLAELDRTYISGLERGLRNPSYLTIKRLCKILEITPNDLFQWEEK